MPNNSSSHTLVVVIVTLTAVMMLGLCLVAGVGVAAWTLLARRPAASPDTFWAAPLPPRTSAAKATEPEKLESKLDPKLDPRLAAFEGKLFLSDLKEHEVHAGPGGFHKGKLADGTLLTVGGKRTPHGLCLHASDRVPAWIKYKLGKTARTFSAEVAFNEDRDPERRLGVVHFSVHGDGQLLWQSSWIFERTKVEKCTIDIKNVDVLQIRVDGYGFSPSTHPVWVEPHLLK